MCDAVSDDNDEVIIFPEGGRGWPRDESVTAGMELKGKARMVVG